MKRIIANLKNKKGFTLTELIIVMAILGILAAIAVPSVAGYLDKARRTTNNQLTAVIENGIRTAITGSELGITGTGTQVATITVTNSTTDPTRLTYTLVSGGAVITPGPSIATAAGAWDTATDGTTTQGLTFQEFMETIAPPQANNRYKSLSGGAVVTTTITVNLGGIVSSATTNN